MNKKVESLFKIIDNLSGNVDPDVAQHICDEISTVFGCKGIMCNDCPFHTAQCLDETAIALEELREKLEENNNE